MSDKERGLYHKYTVFKLDDEGNECPVNDWVFVLNPRTDPFAREALMRYSALSHMAGYQQLSEELNDKIRESLREDT